MSLTMGGGGGGPSPPPPPQACNSKVTIAAAVSQNVERTARISNSFSVESNGAHYRARSCALYVTRCTLRVAGATVLLRRYVEGLQPNVRLPVAGDRGAILAPGDPGALADPCSGYTPLLAVISCYVCSQVAAERSLIRCQVTIEVTSTIDPAVVGADQIATVAGSLVQMGGPMVRWRPDINGTPATATFKFKNHVRVDHFVTDALAVPGVS
jgi:hypothetical protein